jgi:hypothetical protein
MKYKEKGRELEEKVLLTFLRRTKEGNMRPSRRGRSLIYERMCKGSRSLYIVKKNIIMALGDSTSPFSFTQTSTLVDIDKKALLN